nr:hypothetical protein [Mycobacterium sp. UM_NZ2]
MIRRSLREQINPLLCLAAAGTILAYALGQSPAQAVPFTPGQAYAEDHANDICGQFDDDPTVERVWQVLTDLINHGLSGVEAGIAVRESVVSVCPHHIPLVKRFAAYYQQHPTGVFT